MTKTEIRIVLHEGDVIDLEWLKKLLQCLILLKDKKTAGMYVYKHGFDYPKSSCFDCVHIWIRADKAIDYIDEYLTRGWERGKVCFSSERRTYWYEEA